MASDDQVEELLVVIVGDTGAGKTSLVTSLLTETLPETLPKLARTVRFPREDAMPVSLTIVDTDPDGDPAGLEALVSRAAVVLLVYDISQAPGGGAGGGPAVARLGNVWLPAIAQLAPGVPVVLAGNKLDLRWPDEVEIAAHQRFKDRFLAPLMDAWPAVAACVECSALAGRMVPEVFHFARKAALAGVYPEEPLRERLVPLFFFFFFFFFFATSSHPAVSTTSALQARMHRTTLIPIRPMGFSVFFFIIKYYLSHFQVILFRFGSREHD
jgi:Ras family protein T1